MRPSTFSVVAADPDAGEVGVAVQSKFLAVGAAVVWAAGGIGAVATQAYANTSYGPRGLELLKEGASPAEALYELTRDDAQAAQRQCGIVAADGRSATFTGPDCMEWAGGASGDCYAVQGNILASGAVVDAMRDAFLTSKGHLADRLVSALRAGQSAGGDRRGQQSAALYIAKPRAGYGGFNDRYVDLRVDDHATPIEELARLLEQHKLYFFQPLPHEVLPIDGERGREIVRLLKTLRALPAAHAPDYDAAARAALVAYMHAENLEERVRSDETIDVQTLEYLRSHA